MFVVFLVLSWCFTVLDTQESEGFVIGEGFDALDGDPEPVLLPESGDVRFFSGTTLESDGGRTSRLRVFGALGAFSCRWPWATRNGDEGLDPLRFCLSSRYLRAGALNPEGLQRFLLNPASGSSLFFTQALRSFSADASCVSSRSGFALGDESGLFVLETRSPFSGETEASMAGFWLNARSPGVDIFFLNELALSSAKTFDAWFMDPGNPDGGKICSAFLVRTREKGTQLAVALGSALPFHGTPSYSARIETASSWLESGFGLRFEAFAAISGPSWYGPEGKTTSPYALSAAVALALGKINLACKRSMEGETSGHAEGLWRFSAAVDYPILSGKILADFAADGAYAGEIHGSIRIFNEQLEISTVLQEREFADGSINRAVSAMMAFKKLAVPDGMEMDFSLNGKLLFEPEQLLCFGAKASLAVANCSWNLSFSVKDWACLDKSLAEMDYALDFAMNLNLD